jgi:hypothetical protein
MTVKRKNSSTIFLFLLIACNAFTQEKDKTHLSFRSIFQEGIVTGESGNDLQLQFVNGVTYKILFAGAGIGLDYYYERSVPLFLDIRGKILNRPSAPFLFADGGYSYLWQKTKEVNQSNSSGGLFYELGIGYEIHIYKKLKLLFSSGYSYKSLSKTINMMPWILPPPKDAIYKYDYSLRRISLKAGLSF